MKNVTVTIPYDEDKLSALRLYLAEKQLKVEDALVKALDSLYVKAVPQSVQHFLRLRSEEADSPTPEKPKEGEVADPHGKQ